MDLIRPFYRTIRERIKSIQKINKLNPTLKTQIFSDIKKIKNEKLQKLFLNALDAN
jgi:hypothetical protein